jgi:hypothetical protein
MKNLSLILIVDLVFVLLYTVPKLESQDGSFCLDDLKIKTEKVEADTIDVLLHAIISVESNGNDSCVGDKFLIRPSIGCLQIRPVMVREVNRILKRKKEKKRFKLNDRWSRKKSIEMFYIWKDYHHKEDSMEIIARCWNGGPNGYKKKTTEYYWKKVQKELKIINNGMDV